MTDFLINAHSGWQYVALVALVVALFFAFRGKAMTSSAEMTYRITAVVVDIQVALGIAVWVVTSAWNGELLQAWIHPLAGLAALGVLHAFIGRARKADPGEANVIARSGILLALALVVAAIGIAEVF